MGGICWLKTWQYFSLLGRLADLEESVLCACLLEISFFLSYELLQEDLNVPCGIYGIINFLPIETEAFRIPRFYLFEYLADWNLENKANCFDIADLAPVKSLYLHFIITVFVNVVPYNLICFLGYPKILSFQEIPLVFSIFLLGNILTCHSFWAELFLNVLNNVLP